MTPAPKRPLSEEEYLAIERVTEFKSELIDREMRSMGPAGPRHSRIVGNFFAALHRQFRGRRASAHMNEFRVRVAESGLYTYPDVLAFAGDPRVLGHDPDTLLNPQLVVEVMSPNTENFDRGDKFRRYRQMESLTDYVLIAQDQMLVEQWKRQTRDLWTVQYFRDPTDGPRFEQPPAEVALSDIYDGVDCSAFVPEHLR